MDLQLFTTILTIASAVGAGGAIIFASRSRSLITLLKDENAALVGSNTRKDTDIEVLQTKLEAKEKECVIWRDNVTQAPSIELLATKTAQQHGEVITGLSEVVAGIGALTKELRAEREQQK